MLYDITNKNNKCIIISGYHADNIQNIIKIYPDDYIICADKGYQYAKAQNLVPNLVMGDFDSFEGEMGNGVEVIQVPCEKDDTDTMLCLKKGIEKGYDEFIIVGGLGGRFDHSLANVQVVNYGYEKGKFVMLADAHNYVTLIGTDVVKIPKMEGYKLSLLALSDQCGSVSVKGVKYPLSGAVLRNNFPLGISNEFEDDCAIVENKSGKLLIILSRDQKE